MEADLNEGIIALGTCVSSREQREHLKIIGNAMRLCRSYIQKTPSEIWFPIYSRLQWHATINEWTNKFMRSIERTAPRPWVNGQMGSLQQASLHSFGILESKGDILCTRILKDVVWFVWARTVEAGSTSWDINGANVKTIILDMTYFEENGCFEEDHLGFFAAFSSDGLNVIVSHDSLFTGMFERETGKLEKCYCLENRINTPEGINFMCDLPSYQEKVVTCGESYRVVAVSQDGKYVLASNGRYDVEIWSVENGEAIGNPLRGHTDEVRCMEMNAYGTRVVTGSADKTVRVWNGRSEEAIGSSLRGHTEAVMCLAMLPGSSQVASGAWDNSVRIWDISNRE